MTGFFKKIAIAAGSFVALVIGYMPSQAQKMTVSPNVAQSGDIQNVQYCRGPYCRPGYRPGYYPGYRAGYYPRYHPAYRPGWYGGYRGYPYYRSGYRYYNGYWFPLAAFGAGAVIGGATASQPTYVAPAPVPSGHVAWCQARYRSYRVYDNTFQPYNGPRQQCVSPYY
ncbi:BA14K family protein [Rhizobium mesoamericanum]|uniref:BA14K family protein n=1 Tax=Rhizobium mesoamericanum TaxID=1079800 RepID=UPI00042A5198|nr:BA14K family protein [Rhizobium mesoamericanum]